MKRILVPIDFSDCSRAAFRRALDMAKESALEIELLHIFSLPTAPDYQVQGLVGWLLSESEEAIQRFIDEFDTGSLRIGVHVETGRVDEMIRMTAESGGFDLIVMGTHGRSGLSHLLMGSVAERVVRLARCPVLTVKA